MKQYFDLTTLNWTLSGYRPEHWAAGASMELGSRLRPEIAPIPMSVPGSVQAVLRNAGIIADWNYGLNSRSCEWVERREWVLEAMLPDEWFVCADLSVNWEFDADGIDGLGAVFVNEQCVGCLDNAFMPYQFDVRTALRSSGNCVRIVFSDQPAWLGQIGYTSRMSLNKPRFNYGWDWTPRLVQLGVFGSVHLTASKGGRIEAWRGYTEFDPASGTGHAIAVLQCLDAEGMTVELSVRDGDRVIGSMRAPAGQMDYRLELLQVEPWWPNGLGEARSYQLHILLLDADGVVVDQSARAIGFRHIAWRPCEGAAPDALPWVCVVNDRPVFLQGFNWVPIRPNFADVTDEMIRQRLETYRDLGTNVLRVWGGAVLESETFYAECDRLGILVWQELPLSSSGIDNWPPETPEGVATMCEIAESYVARRQHHPSLLMWCGGNELQGSLTGGKQGIGLPVTIEHPMLAAAGSVIARLDPTRRFVPTSASGPTFTADESRFGQGLHHDVHGPWNHTGDLASWKKYWDGDDALLRSEAGMPGASPTDLIRAHADGHELPADATNPYYLHTASWWLQWDTYGAAGGDLNDLDAYVQWSQSRQAEFLSIAARACKDRFPRCGGFIGWMGHDCFPVPINTSVIDYDGRAKPAAWALRDVFQNRPINSTAPPEVADA